MSVRSVTGCVIVLLFINLGIKNQVDESGGYQEYLQRYKEENGLVMASPLRVYEVHINEDVIPRGQKFELTFRLDATYDNPFDPDEIRINCEIIIPGGVRAIIPGFFYTPYSSSNTGTVEAVRQPVWKVRFTPRIEGEYRYRIIASDRKGEIETQFRTFVCSRAEYNGFVRVSAAKPTAFEFDSGKPYYPVGFNLLPRTWSPPDRPIPGDRETRQRELIDLLADAGGTFIRLRADSYYNAIEATFSRESGFLGPGWYNQYACWIIDSIYQAAEPAGIQIMHCLFNANALLESQAEQISGSRINFILKQNGGPCESAGEFWTNRQMLKLVRQKLRYSIARWGYSSSLMCWELFNEVSGLDRNDRIAWHRDMAGYLHANDHHEHLVTTSTKDDWEDVTRFWSMPEIDIVQIHVYDQQDNAAYLTSICERVTRMLKKPLLLGEFGLHHRLGSWNDADPEGVGMHNAIWSTALSGGGGISDWYTGNVVKHNLFLHYTAFTRWAADIPWNDVNLVDLEVDNVDTPVPADRNVPGDLLIVGLSSDVFARMPVERFRVDRETRQVSNIEYLQPYLHGLASRKTRPTFILDCDKASEFQVLVSASIGDRDNRLNVYIDGKLAKSELFPAAEGEGDVATYAARYDNWRVFYDQPRRVSVEVPPGHHEVMVEAKAKDRLHVTYRLNGYFSGSGPLRVIGKRTDVSGWIWVHNSISTAANGRAGIQTTTVPASSAVIRDLPDGYWEVEWYDPWSMSFAGTSRNRSVNGLLRLEIPEFDRDIACKIRLLR